MLKKVQDVESKLSSLTLTKLDLMSFLEDITTELKLLKHKLQLPYLGHKFSITTPPSDSSDDEILDLVSIDESESPKDNDYVPVPFGSYLSPELSTKNLLKTKKLSKVQTLIYKLLILYQMFRYHTYIHMYLCLSVHH